MTKDPIALLRDRGLRAAGWILGTIAALVLAFWFSPPIAGHRDMLALLHGDRAIRLSQIKIAKYDSPTIVINDEESCRYIESCLRESQEDSPYDFLGWNQEERERFETTPGFRYYFSFSPYGTADASGDFWKNDDGEAGTSLIFLAHTLDADVTEFVSRFSQPMPARLQEIVNSMTYTRPRTFYN